MDGIVKDKAEIPLNIQVLGDDLTSQNVTVVSHSDNISFDETTKIITIENANETTASLTLASAEKSYYTGTFNFSIVPGGVNIYDYNDLLLTTNYSTSGEISVMQKSLGSLKDVYEGVNEEIEPGSNQAAYKWIPNLPLKKKESAKNIELFGNYKADTGEFNFENELYEMETTYNHKFLDAWNEANPDKQVPTNIKIGIRVQKDFYGNGFNINMNNLCFPSNGSVSSGNNGKLTPSSKDYFQGPLAYVTIGEPTLGPDVILVKAFGQDNAGMILDGNNITLNGLRIQNIDDNSNKRNYNYCGTVIEVNGKNNVIKNSEISLGKNLVRAFDSDGLLIKNSILKRSSEFNLMVGSNEVIFPNDEKNVSIRYDEATLNEKLSDFLSMENDSPASANSILETYLRSGESGSSKDGLFDALKLIQDSLNNSQDIIESDGTINYAATIKLEDCNFSDSGIFSIAFETCFNGPYLYNGLSETVSSAINSIAKTSVPDKIGGTSRPVKIILDGNTKFYDWKKIDDIDISSLIDENISKFDIPGYDVSNISVDTFFPIKNILRKMCDESGYIYKYENEDYVNSMIAFYGGGKNYSSFEIIDENLKANICENEIEVDLLQELGNVDFNSSTILSVLSKCVLFAAGFEPFNFYVNNTVSTSDPYLFGLQPNYMDLKTNL